MKSKIIYLGLIIISVLTSCQQKHADYYRFIDHDPRFNIIGRVPVDEKIVQKVSCYHFYYDDLKNVIKVEFLNNGELAEDEENGVAIIKISYTDSIISETFYDEKSNKARNKYFVHENKIVLKEKTKFPIKLIHLGTNGKIVADNNGVAKTLWTLNEKGQRIKSEYFDINGEKKLIKSDNFSVDRQFDDNNNLVLVTFHYEDTLEENRAKYTKYKYDKWGNQVSWENYNNRGELMNKNYWVHKYDKNGNEIEISINDPKLSIENPIIEKTEIAKIKYEYNKYWETTKISYFDRFDKLTKDQQGIEIINYKYDDNQNVIEETYFDNKDRLADNKKGLAKIKYDFDTINYLIDEHYFDRLGKELTKDTTYLSSEARFNINRYLFIALLRVGSDSSRLNYLNRAICLNRFNPSAYVRRADLLSRMGQLSLAKNDAEVALSLSMDDEAGIYNRFNAVIDINMQLKEWDSSIFYLTKFLNFQIGSDRFADDYDNILRTYLKRAGIYLELKLENNAIDDLKAAIDYYFKDREYVFASSVLEEVEFSLGAIYYDNKKNYRQALKHFSNCLSFNEKIGRYHYARGLCNLRLGNVKQGCKDMTKAGELGYSDAFEYLRDFCN